MLTSLPVNLDNFRSFCTLKMIIHSLTRACGTLPDERFYYWRELQYAPSFTQKITIHCVPVTSATVTAYT